MSKTIRIPLLLAAIFAIQLAGPARPAAAESGGADSGWQRKVDAELVREAAFGETDFIVHLSRQADLSGAAAFETKAEKGRFVYERLTSVARASQPSVTAVLDALGVPYQTFWIVNAIWVRGGADAIATVARHPEVRHVYRAGHSRLAPPIEAQPAPMSSEVVEAVGSNIAKVRAPEVWALGFTGQGVTVAGADTGVFWTHPALKSKYRGWNGTTADHSYNWHDAIKNPNTACPGSSPEPCDDDAVIGGGHGTHTVGTIVGDDGAANQIGMAPGAKWIACRNMNNGLGVVPTYLECMEWFLAPTDSNGQNPDPSKSPDVINNSWACVEGCAPPLLKLQIDASRAAGIVYVVSAGNEGQAGCSSIAFPLMVYQSAFTVGATNIGNDVIANFSSRGPVMTNPLEGVGYRKPDISAPGVSVRSALRNGGYGNLSGTSMAGPHVAGLVALIISARPSLAGNVDRIEEIIEQTAVHLTTSQGCGGDSPTAVPNNVYGWGRIDALAAVLAALNKPPDAVDDEATTEHDTPVTIDVLANDSDPDGTPLSVTGVTQGSNGSVVNNGDGTVTYSPNAGFSGSDGFTYTIGDGEGGSDTANVGVTVLPPPAFADLQVTNILASNAKPREGDRVTVTATIANAGTAAAAGSQTEFLLDGASSLGLVDTPALPAGGSAEVSVLWDTRGVKGEHSIRVTADRAAAVAESIEDNNAGTFTFTVQGNKVKNGSFEQSSSPAGASAMRMNSSSSGPEGWTASSTAAGTATWSDGGSDGEKSAATSGNGGNAALAGSPSWTSDPIPVAPGETFDLVVSVQSLETSSAATAGLVYLGAAGQVVSSVTLLTAPLTTSGFATLERAVTIPPGVAQVRVKLTGFAPTDLATNGTVRFDGVGLFGR